MCARMIHKSLAILPKELTCQKASQIIVRAGRRGGAGGVHGLNWSTVLREQELGKVPCVVWCVFGFLASAVVAELLS